MGGCYTFDANPAPSTHVYSTTGRITLLSSIPGSQAGEAYAVCRRVTAITSFFSSAPDKPRTMMKKKGMRSRHPIVVVVVVVVVVESQPSEMGSLEQWRRNSQALL